MKLNSLKHKQNAKHVDTGLQRKKKLGLYKCMQKSGSHVAKIFVLSGDNHMELLMVLVSSIKFFSGIARNEPIPFLAKPGQHCAPFLLFFLLLPLPVFASKG